MSPSRRRLFQLSASAGLAAALPRRAEPAPPADEPPAPIAALKPMTEGVSPITVEERRGRVARAQKLLRESDLDALVLGPGTSLTYFTGAVWGLSERFFGAVITRDGEPAWVTPAFERARGLEQIQIGTDIRAWQEHDSPYALLASILKDRKAAGRVGLDEYLPFVFADGLARALPTARLLSGTGVTAGCRVIKDAHEVALMRRAGEITVQAHRAVFASLKEGLTQAEVGRLCSDAHRRLGMNGGALVLFGKDAAFPHGTEHPQPLKAGDVVLLDGGGRLHGYASDITRTAVFGAPPTERQRRIWDVVRQAQEAAFKAARPGVECQAVDAAARRVVEAAGFGKEYEQFTHRVGHGIGMDGHEWTYLVRGNATPLQPGMCFSDEPGIYIPGEIGVRHEDVITITEDGAANLTKWTGTPEDPAVV
jgi:Xaa-Pro aminopeptidase